MKKKLSDEREAYVLKGLKITPFIVFLYPELNPSANIANSNL